jgi:hypothetical protein
VGPLGRRLTWPRKLVQTFRMLMGDEATAAEGFTRLTWEIAEIEPGVSKLTVNNDLECAATLAALVRGEMEDHGGPAAAGPRCSAT